jgi:SAM-dependent methyltransferase
MVAAESFCKVVKRRCITAGRRAIRRVASALGPRLPLRMRQAFLLRLAPCNRLCGFNLSMGLLDDWRRSDPDSLHRFLWSNHLAYASRYEVAKKFGAGKINVTRHLLFAEILKALRARGLDPQQTVRSVFEVGCSMGYLLRHLEEEIFPQASVLRGLDIDRRAVQAGTVYLRSVQSKVRLFTADLTQTARIMGRRKYDITLCCGVLMYVNPQTAWEVLKVMFARTRWFVGLICLADSEGRDALGNGSKLRESDGAYIHDVKGLVEAGGGRLVCRKWVGAEVSGSNSSCIVLAEPVRSVPETDT